MALGPSRLEEMINANLGDAPLESSAAEVKQVDRFPRALLGVLADTACFTIGSVMKVDESGLMPEFLPIKEVVPRRETDNNVRLVFLDPANELFVFFLPGQSIFGRISKGWKGGKMGKEIHLAGAYSA